MMVYFIFTYAQVCVPVSAGNLRGQKVLDLLEMELYVVVCHPTWVPGTKLQEEYMLRTLTSSAKNGCRDLPFLGPPSHYFQEPCESSCYI